MKLAKKQNKNIDLLFDVIDKLANDEPLEAKFRDHSLTGDYISFRECHIEPNWLLIYKKEADILVLLLQRVGSHSELF
ncbi:MAG: type II toxin-antitoxin system YafQ family toxin [Oscillospiraceae bacterium]|nr:type II toxin-antitoxin system YafQ family toxin [Oscillospiraceae bacterium]